MRAFVRPNHRCLGLLFLGGAVQVHCVPEDESSLPAPGGGVVTARSLRTESGGGGTAGASAVDDGTGVRVGACDGEGASRACTAESAFGCVEGRQTCIDGAWSLCLFAADSSSN